MKIHIKKEERGLIYKEGDYKGILPPGDHTILPFSEKKVVIKNLNKAFTTEDNLNLLLEDPELKKLLDVVEVKDGELLLHFEDSRFEGIYQSGQYAFWNVLKKHEFRIIDLSIPEIAPDINRALFQNPKLTGYFTIWEVLDYETGLLFKNGVYERQLAPGRYYFWNSPVSISIIKADLRLLQLDLTGQEIMTQDKVTLRLNFVCQFKIVNPETVIIKIKDYQSQLHILMQMILREYVGGMKLDDLLQNKEELGSFALNRLKEKEQEMGLLFQYAGVKDIILPGEIKDILNTVLLAEKRAQANVITRREETASTRSLLNTAKLMDENKTLARLKELEFLEKICEKIGTISLSGGGTLLEHLNLLLEEKKGDR